MLNVFLTGATGFLGGELAVALSKVESVNRLVCLIRAATDDEARGRLQRMFAFHQDVYDGSKVMAVAGDLTDEGLPKSLCRQRMLSGTNVIIHAAAHTSFLPQRYSEIECTNVGGTQKMLSWASCLPNLKTFAYIGTATIAGGGEDVLNRTIHEDESPNGQATHMVGYTRSKMVAELAARNALPQEKLLVIRPSILLGDSRCLTPRSFDIAWIIVAVKQLRMFFGNPDAVCDIIPVDYAANAIVKLVTGTARNTTYHVSAGMAATTCRQIAHAVDYNDRDTPPLIFGSERELSLVKSWLRNGDNPHPDLVPCFSHLEYIRSGMGKKKARLLLFGLEHYWDFINLGQRFDNSRLLADTGIGLPEPAHEYLKRTAAYFSDVDPFCAAANP